MKDKNKKDEKFDINDPKWGGTMRDVRDALARGEGLNSDPYPYDNPEETEYWRKKRKNKGCLSRLFSFLRKR